MEEYSQEIVDNIKHEPEVHFTCYLPEIPESDEEPEVKEVKIVVRKFDKTWKSPAKLFGSYFVCGKCEYVNKHSGNMKKHLKLCKTLEKCEKCCLKSKSEEIIKCYFCDQQFNCNNCKSTHISQVHRKDSIWHCSKCDYKTSTINNLKSHYQIHVKKFSCETCEQKFSNKQCLKYHQQFNRHGDYGTEAEIKFECETCIYSFLTKIGLRKHEREVHSKLKLHCDICGRITKTKVHLRQHMQTHFKVRCPVCNHFLAKRSLQSHIENHSTSPSLVCDACDKIYFNLNALKIHKSQKHKIEQVQCDLCQKIFKNKLLLRQHMNNHLKVSCQTCNRSMCKTSLNQHMKTHSAGQESLAFKIVKRK